MKSTVRLSRAPAGRRIGPLPLTAPGRVLTRDETISATDLPDQANQR